MPDLTDLNSDYYIKRIKEGDNDSISDLCKDLKKALKRKYRMPNAERNIIKIFHSLASDEKNAAKATGKKSGDPCKYLKLLAEQVKKQELQKLDELSKFLVIEILSNLAANPALVRKAVGRASRGRPVDRDRRDEDKRYALLVAYYYEECGTLGESMASKGAFVLAASHVFKTDDPTNAQVRRAQHSWEKHKKHAQRVWKTLTSNGPIHPKKHYPLGDEYWTVTGIMERKLRELAEKGANKKAAEQDA